MAGALGGVAANPLIGIFALGVGILLQYLFPQKVEGPRQDNTKVSTAKYGDTIGRCHGTARLAGSYVWLKGDKIQEQKNTYRAGKGGPIVTEYSYISTSMAVFDWTGPCDAITRVWLDDDLVYDGTTEALQGVLSGTPGRGFGTASGVTFTFYFGSDTQEPNALYVADKGAANCSAFRGLVYVVMAGLNHEESGIRLPNIEIEIVRNATYSYQSKLLTNSDYLTGHSKDCYVDEVQKIAVFYDDAISGSTTNKAWAYDLVTGNVLWSKAIVYTSGLTGIDGDPFFDHKGNVWFTDRNGTNDAYDLLSGTRKESLDFEHSHAAINSNNFNRTQAEGSITYGFFFRGTVIDFKTCADGVWTGVSSVEPGWNAHILCRGASIRVQSGVITAYLLNGTTLYRVTDLGSVTSSDLGSLYGTGTLGTVFYVPNDDTVVVRASNKWVKLDADTLALVASYSTAPTNDPNQSAEQVGVTSDGYLWYSDNSVANSSTYVLLDLVNMEEVKRVGPIAYSTGENEDASITYVEAVSAFLSLRGDTTNVWHLDFEPTVTRGTVQLADVLEAECALAGLTVDVTGVSKTLRGYAIKDESTPRGVIEDLCRIFGIDHCQVDGVYKFWERNSTSVLTLTADHIGASFKDNGFPVAQVKETVADVLDLPNSVTLDYRSWSASHRTGSQRIDMPLDSTDSITEAKFSTSTSLTDDEAAQAADVLLREVREVQDLYEFSLPPYYARLHPGDVITVPLERTYSLKLVIEEIEDDLVLRVKAHKRTILYSSTAVGAAVNDVTNSRIFSSTVYFVPIDCNMLRDNSDDDNGGFYFAGYYRGQTAPPHMNIFRSLNGGASYDGWASLTGFASVGVVLTELTAPSSPYVIHETAYFDFLLYSGTVPASVTSDQFLNEELAFAVETTTDEGGTWEIILAQTITNNGDGTYRASRLVRGFRGTENMMDDHEVGNRMIVLDAEVMARTVDGQLNVEQMFVPISPGLEFDDDNAISFTNLSASLMPFKPVDIRGVRDTGATESLTVTWQRQTRYNYQWLDGSETVPLNETSEKYEAQIYEGVTLRRTKTNLTSPTFVYTLAEYTTDAGGSPTVIPTVRVVIYQISQELNYNSGRGYPGEATL